MATPKKAKVEEPETDERAVPRPEDYDDEAEQERGERLSEQTAKDPAFEPVPDGGQFDGPDLREERAEYLREHPLTQPDLGRDPDDLDAGPPPSATEVFAAKNRDRAEGQKRRRAEREAADRSPEFPDDDEEGGPISSPESIEARLARLEGQAGLRQPVARIVPPTGRTPTKPFLLVQKFGGKYSVYLMPSLEFARGRVQDMQGEKRLFELDLAREGEELQEVNAAGRPMNR